MDHRERNKGKERQRIKAKNSNHYQSWIIFGVILFTFLGAISFKDISNDTYIDGIGLIVFLVFLAFSLISLNYLINRTEITISKNRITTINRFRKKTYKNIHGFKEDSYKGKYGYIEKLVFKTETGFIVIDSSSHLNYFEIVNFTTKNHARLNDESFKRYDFQQTLFIRIFFLFAAFLFLGIFSNRQLENIDQLENDLQTTQITLAANPIIKRGQGRNKQKHIRIYSKEYPEFEFRIAGDKYDACNKSILKELRKGEKIEIGVNKDILQSKLLQSKEPSFWTKYFHWKKISIYQLNRRNKKYISLIKLKMLRKADRFWSWISLTFGLFSVYMLVRKY